MANSISTRRVATATTSASVVDLIYLTDPGFGIQVTNLSGAAPLWFTVDHPGGSCAQPTLFGDNFQAASMTGAISVVRHQGQFGSIVQLISSGATTYMVNVLGSQESEASDNSLAAPGGGGAASPIAGFQAWYDASQITGVVNGGNVNPWNDLSGNGNTLTPYSGGGTAGVYRTNQLNGLAAVELAGTGMLVSVAFSGGGLTVGTVFIVADSIQTTLGGGSGNNYFFDGITSTNRWAMGYGIINSGDMTTYAGGVYNGYAESIPSGFAQWTATFAGDATSQLRKNGSNEFTQNIGADTLTGITLGDSYAAGDLGSSRDVKICEFILYPSVLSGANITAVESYLNTKWGV